MSMLIGLTQHERDALLIVLVVALRNLREEIHNTQTAEYRQTLQQRKSVLKGLLDRLSTAEPWRASVPEPMALG
jgi:hypothetical protein